MDEKLFGSIAQWRARTLFHRNGVFRTHLFLLYQFYENCYLYIMKTKVLFCFLVALCNAGCTSLAKTNLYSADRNQPGKEQIEFLLKSRGKFL